MIRGFVAGMCQLQDLGQNGRTERTCPKNTIRTVWGWRAGGDLWSPRMGGGGGSKMGTQVHEPILFVFTLC